MLAKGAEESRSGGPRPAVTLPGNLHFTCDLKTSPYCLTRAELVEHLPLRVAVHSMSPCHRSCFCGELKHGHPWNTPQVSSFPSSTTSLSHSCTTSHLDCSQQVESGSK
ncbi:uncharacterized protein encoded by LINC01548 [Gorilla gorilla gorilla]|uniref:uncharacterized protein encoded by LINC01548 n=1 Tax=Gorilla gorilla gorilla TaxID=9595 RepID=UPI0001FA1428